MTQSGPPRCVERPGSLHRSHWEGMEGGGFLPEPAETLPARGEAGASPPAAWQDVQQQQRPGQHQQWRQQPPGSRRRPPPPPASQRQQQQPKQRPGVYRPPPPDDAGPGAAPDPGLLEEHPEAGGGCSRCSSLSFNAEWLRAFGVVLCNACRREEPLIAKVRGQSAVRVVAGGGWLAA